jgi:hypothetical protein
LLDVTKLAPGRQAGRQQTVRECKSGSELVGQRERERERECEGEREREREAAELLSAANRKYDYYCKIGVMATTQTAADWVPCACQRNKTILIPSIRYKEFLQKPVQW